MRLFDPDGWSQFHKEDNGYWSEKRDDTRAVQIIEGEDGWYIHAHEYGTPNTVKMIHGPYRSKSKAKAYAKRHREDKKFWADSEGETEP